MFLHRYLCVSSKELDVVVVVVVVVVVMMVVVCQCQRWRPPALACGCIPTCHCAVESRTHGAAIADRADDICAGRKRDTAWWRLCRCSSRASVHRASNDRTASYQLLSPDGATRPGSNTVSYTERGNITDESLSLILWQSNSPDYMAREALQETTYIRVHSLPWRQMIGQLRRGAAHYHVQPCCCSCMQMKTAVKIYDEKNDFGVLCMFIAIYLCWL